MNFFQMGGGGCGHFWNLPYVGAAAFIGKFLDSPSVRLETKVGSYWNRR